MVALCSYSAREDWATLRLADHGIKTTATLVNSLRGKHPTLYGSFPVTIATLSYRDGETPREIQIELTSEIGRHLEEGQTFPIVYDKSHPSRVLHPWTPRIVDRFWRAIAGIVIFGGFAFGIFLLTRDKTLTQ